MIETIYFEEVTAHVIRHVPAGKNVGSADLSRPLPSRQMLGESPMIYLNGELMLWGKNQDVWEGENPEAGELRFHLDLCARVNAPGYKRTLQSIYENLRQASDTPLWQRGIRACRSLRRLRRTANKTTMPDFLKVYILHPDKTTDNA